MNFHIEDILEGVIADDEATHNAAVVKVVCVVVLSQHEFLVLSSLAFFGQALSGKQPVIALFDNGDKQRETQFYCRYMPVGSVLLLHDWEHLELPRPHWELNYEMVQEELEARGFEVRCDRVLCPAGSPFSA